MLLSVKILAFLLRHFDKKRFLKAPAHGSKKAILSEEQTFLKGGALGILESNEERF